MERPRTAGPAAAPGPAGRTAGLGAGLRRGPSDRFTVAAARPQQRHCRLGVLPEPRCPGHADADGNPAARLGLVPRPRRAAGRGGALARRWRPAGLGLYLPSLPPFSPPPPGPPPGYGPG